MEEYIKKYWRDSLISSVLLLILALVLMIKPTESMNVIIIAFGAICIISGIIHTISYFFVPHEMRMFNFELIEGAVSLIAGVVIASNPVFVSSFIIVIIGIWMVLSSIIRIQISVNMQYIEGKSWVWMLILAFVVLISGILIIANPAGMSTALPTLVGALLFMAEIINIVEYICIIPKVKAIK